MLKGLLRIRRYNQQETPYALQEAEQFSWLQFGEAYSALRGWRPIPAALRSHSVLRPPLRGGTYIVPGLKIIPSNLTAPKKIEAAPTQGKTHPDKHRSIRKKAGSVKSFDISAGGKLDANQPFGRRFVRTVSSTGRHFDKESPYPLRLGNPAGASQCHTGKVVTFA